MGKTKQSKYNSYFTLSAGIVAVFTSTPITAQECLEVYVSPMRAALRQPVEVRSKVQMSCPRCGPSYGLPQVEWHFPNTEEQLGGGTGPFTIHYVKPGRHPITAKITYINARDPSDVCVVTLKNIAYVEVTVNHPTELLRFSAEAATRGIRLQWIVGYEHKVQEYIVERKDHNNLYTTVQRVEAQGKTAYEPFKYEVIDYSADKTKRTTYRLRVITTEGKAHELSQVTYSGAGTPPPHAAREIVVVLKGNQKEYFGKVYVALRSGTVHIVDPSGRIPPGQYTIVSASDNSLVGKTATVVQAF